MGFCCCLLHSTTLTQQQRLLQCNFAWLDNAFRFFFSSTRLFYPFHSRCVFILNNTTPKHISQSARIVLLNFTFLLSFLLLSHIINSPKTDICSRHIICQLRTFLRLVSFSTHSLLLWPERVAIARTSEKKLDNFLRVETCTVCTTMSSRYRANKTSNDKIKMKSTMSRFRFVFSCSRPRQSGKLLIN